MKLKKQELISKLARKASTSQSVAKRVIDALGDIAVEELAKENAITLFKGFVIYGKRVEGRTWENPLIGGTEVIPERIVPRARFSDDLKRQLKELS